MRRVMSGLPFLLCLALATAASAQDARLQFMRLHDALHLSAEQEDAWRGYMAAIAPRAETQARHQAAQVLLPKLTTLRRIALIDATMTQDLADARRQGEAVAAFYADLTPDQQRTFDRQTLPSETQSGSAAPASNALKTPPLP